MIAFLFGRLALLLPTMLGVATLTFFLLHAIPGDPVDMMLGETAAPADRDSLRRDLGLDRPISEQYFRFLAGLTRGDLGQSVHGRPVADLVMARLPATIELALAASVMALLLAIPAGIWSANRPRGILDRISLGASLAGVAIPNFWLGPMLILLFAIELGALPVSGRGTAAHVVLPALTLGLSMAGILTRMTRTAMIEVLGEDFVRTGRAKGLESRRILTRHALPNALKPILTVFGLQLGGLLTGTVITETIFAWPGIGRLTIQAIQGRDYPVVQGCVLVIALAYVLVNAATDVGYAWADPRIRRGSR